MNLILMICYAWLFLGISVSIIADEQVVLRVNCGAKEDYTDKAGKTWLADRWLIPGGPWGATGGGVVLRQGLTIKKTDIPDVYLNEHYNIESYTFNVENGTYALRFHFAETYPKSAQKGSRIFAIKVNGRKVIDRIDPFADAGGFATPLVRTAEKIKVTKNQIKVEFVSQESGPEINGIEIVAQSLSEAQASKLKASLSQDPGRASVKNPSKKSVKKMVIALQAFIPDSDSEHIRDICLKALAVEGVKGRMGFPATAEAHVTMAAWQVSKKEQQQIAIKKLNSKSVRKLLAIDVSCKLHKFESNGFSHYFFLPVGEARPSLAEFRTKAMSAVNLQFDDFQGLSGPNDEWRPHLTLFSVRSSDEQKVKDFIDDLDAIKTLHLNALSLVGFKGGAHILTTVPLSKQPLKPESSRNL